MKDGGALLRETHGMGGAFQPTHLVNCLYRTCGSGETFTAKELVISQASRINVGPHGSLA